MKRLFIVLVMFISVFLANAQVVEKTFADLKNEGNAAIKNKEYAKALDLYEQALTKLGNQAVVDTSMIYNMGYCAINAKNYEKALKYFDQAIAMNYKVVNANLNKAEAYKALKNDAESLKALEAALAAAPDDAKVKSKLAAYYAKDAASLYSKGSSIILKANNEVTAGKLKTTDAPYKAALQKGMDEYKKALPIIEKSLSYDPANATSNKLKTAVEQALKE